MDWRRPLCTRERVSFSSQDILEGAMKRGWTHGNGGVDGGATWCELLWVWLQAAAAVGAGKDDRAIRRVVVKEMGA